MDIYSYAKNINYNADYYDTHTGRIYKIQDYGLALKRGLPTKGIAIYEDGKLLGYAKKKEVVSRGNWVVYYEVGVK